MISGKPLLSNRQAFTVGETTDTNHDPFISEFCLLAMNLIDQFATDTADTNHEHI